MSWLEKTVHKAGIKCFINKAFSVLDWYPYETEELEQKNFTKAKTEFFDFICSIKADEKIRSMYDLMPYFIKKASKSKHKGLVQELKEYEKNHKPQKPIRLYDSGFITEEM